MKSVRMRFGSYNFIETKTAFNPALFDKYLVQVIPELSHSESVRAIRAKRKGVEYRKLNLRANTDVDEPLIRKVALGHHNSAPKSPQKNVSNAQNGSDLVEKVASLKRNSTESVINGDTPKPSGKKAKLNSSQVQNVPPITSDRVKLENEIESSTEAGQMNGHALENVDQHFLNSTECEYSGEETTLVNHSTISDMSVIDEHLIEEISFTASHDDTDIEDSFSNIIDGTLKEAYTQIRSALTKRLNPTFESLKMKLKAVTLERDQVASQANDAKLKAKENHAKEIAELNEKYTQIAMAKKDAETMYTAELEKQKNIAENDLKEANRLMAEKLAEAKKMLEDAKVKYDKEKEESHAAFVELQKNHQLAMDAAKEQATDDIKILKKAHSEQITEMERKIADRKKQESQLEDKYRDIVAGIRQKAETERKERMACMCCGKELEIKRICSEQCKKMW